MRNKVVYLHRRKSDKEVFYVGMGGEYRPYQFHKPHRNNYWCNYVKKYGEPIVEVIKRNLTKQEAFKLEKELIKKYGRKIKNKGSLVNITEGGDFNGAVEVLEKKVLCLKTGRVFDSIRKYSNKNNIPHSSISTFLNKDFKLNCNSKDLLVRFVESNKVIWIPFFDGNESQELVPYKENKFKVTPTISQSQIDDLAVKFNKLKLLDRYIFFLTIHKPYRDISKEIGISIDTITRTVRRVRETITGKKTIKEEIGLYHKVCNKINLNLSKRLGDSDFLSFENISKSYTINLDHREEFVNQISEEHKNKGIEKNIILNNKSFNQWLIDNELTRTANTKVYKSKLNKKMYYELDLIKMYTKRKSVA